MKRPLTVTIIAVLLLLAGAWSLVTDALHFRTLAPGAMVFAVVFVHLLAIVSGVFLLRGRNWARWLTVAWMALHVGISVRGPASALLIHAAFLLLFAWFLFFDAEAKAWFAHPQPA